MSARLIFVVVLLAAGNLMAGDKPPYKLLFGNDTTHITSCPSPFNPRPGPFVEEHIRACVQESAVEGVDAHLLQPGMGWVPWWQSEVYPMADHVQWLAEHGIKPHAYERYILNGGDLVAAYVEECRKQNIAPLISFRLNDSHFLSHAKQDYQDEAAVQNAREAVCRFYGENPQFIIGDETLEKHYKYLQDWAHPEVRDYRFRLIKELCENYDIEGIELDFLRHPCFFDRRKTTDDERSDMMAGFVRRIRNMMDALEKNDGKKRWLGIRVTAYPDRWGEIGVDLQKLTDAGLNWVNCSSHYFTDLGMEIARIREMAPGHVALYSELHYVTAVGPYREAAATTGRNSAGSVRRMTDPLQFYTAANLAYEQGADGVSLFNFHYYRGSRGVYTRDGGKEPPFDILKYLTNRDWLEKQPQWYFIGATFNPLMSNEPFTKTYAIGKPETFRLLMTPPQGGWSEDGRLRLLARDPLGDSSWSVVFNGHELKRTDDVSEPYDVRYTTGILEPEYYRAFTVPHKLLRDGENEIEVMLLSGKKMKLFYLDIAVE
ncbi:alpha-amylase family protein [Tichowtungia aerotolerans]|uniref:Glycosyl hydrolase-like 10 domain-containing protein n=1 Tax=Tichowtungia aerotolerans TaxID=2697043 RepID=A0A6P1M5I1_9BACT|nr:hypothetical protein [Tichowtungia aerotolerans]QHI69840.1 hypothetical protein GT409_10385 [Tichowtungia aerotolerans]